MKEAATTRLTSTAPIVSITARNIPPGITTAALHRVITWYRSRVTMCRLPTTVLRPQGGVAGLDQARDGVAVTALAPVGAVDHVRAAAIIGHRPATAVVTATTIAVSAGMAEAVMGMAADNAPRRFM